MGSRTAGLARELASIAGWWGQGGVVGPVVEGWGGCGGEGIGRWGRRASHRKAMLLTHKYACKAGKEACYRVIRMNWKKI